MQCMIEVTRTSRGTRAYRMTHHSDTEHAHIYTRVTAASTCRIAHLIHLARQNPTSCTLETPLGNFIIAWDNTLEGKE